VVTVALFSAASALGQRLVVSNWLVWAAGVAATLALASGVAFVMGLSRESQHAVLRRAAEVVRKPRPRPPAPPSRPGA